MKKVLASILLFTIAIISIVNCFAKVSITKENLQDAYNELAKKYEGGYQSIKGSYGFTIREATTPIKVEDSELKYEIELFDGTKETKTIKYNLSDKPIFYVEQVIDKDTSLSELYDIFDNMELPIYGAIGSAIVQGVNPNTANTMKDEFDAGLKIRKYSGIMLAGSELSIGEMTNENDKRVFKEGETDNFEFLDYAINDEVNLKDDILNFYTYKFTKTKKNDNIYLLRAELVVNLDADLSKVIEKNEDNSNNTTNNSIANKIVLTSASGNVANNTVNNTTNNTVNNTSNNVVNNNVNNTSNNVVNNTTSKSGMPYVGSSTTVLKVMFVFIIIALYYAVRIERIGKQK